jgi:hypothetical protein
MNNRARRLASLLIARTPLVDGRFVVDLINTNEPGSAFAKAALVASSVEQPDLGDVGVYAAYAARDFADAHGYDGQKAIADAGWAQLDVMREDLYLNFPNKDKPL